MTRVWYVERHVPELSSPKVIKKKKAHVTRTLP